MVELSWNASFVKTFLCTQTSSFVKIGAQYLQLKDNIGTPAVITIAR